MPVAPDVSRCERDEDGRGAFLTDIVDELPQVPPERIDHLVPAVGLEFVDMAGISRSGDVGPFLEAVDGPHVIVSELNEYIVAWLYAVVHLVPPSLVEEGAAGASRHGAVGHGDFLRVEDVVCHGTPSPHAILVLVGVLHRTVAGEEHHRLAFLPLHLCRGWFHSDEARFEEGYPRMVASSNSLGGTSGVEHRPELAGVYLVAEEMVVHLLRSKSFEFACGDVVEVDVRHLLFFRHEAAPLTMRLSHHVSVLPGVSRRERHQHGECTSGTRLVDEPSEISSIAIDILSAVGGVALVDFLHVDM